MGCPAKKNSAAGFTLLELLLSISLIAIIAGIAVPIGGRMHIRGDLDATVDQAVQSFRRAQTLSRGASGDSMWGVSVQQGSIILFKGPTYASRDASYDEIFTSVQSVTPSGITEINFQKATGDSNQVGTLTLTAPTNDVRTITINAKGLLTY